MNLKAYVSFVELPTKIASLIPFIIGVLYTLYRYGKINLSNLSIMFISMITFDMATTAINNYCDYKNEIKYYKDKYNGRNPMFIYGISEKVGLGTIVLLLSIATLCGIILTFKTNLFVLFLGAICFFVGIFYTFGPIPISRMPLGEVFSGGFMGFLIPLITIYSTIYNDGYFNVYVEKGSLLANINIIEGIVIFIICIPLIVGIANIMLANNICDLESDIEVGRYTLPYYIGKNMSIKLFRYLYYIGYIVIIISVFTKILPVTALITLISIIPVEKKIRLFENKQLKSETFITSVKNFTIIGFLYAISIGLSVLIK